MPREAFTWSSEFASEGQLSHQLYGRQKVFLDLGYFACEITDDGDDR